MQYECTFKAIFNLIVVIWKKLRRGGFIMIIDFHTHTFPDFLAPKVIPKLEKGSNMHASLDGTMASLERSMEEAGVDISIVLPVATSPSQVITCNNSSLSINEEKVGRIISFGAMHPDYEDYKNELRRIKEHGIKGIKLHPDYQNTMIDDIKYKRVIDAASELGLITIIHAGLDIGLPGPIHAVPTGIKNLVTEVKPEKMILAHMGGFSLWEEVIEVLAEENVYLDTAFSLGSINYFDDCSPEIVKQSMMNEELFRRMMDAFGEDRILFATDSPWAGQKETLESISEIGLTEVQNKKILGENARVLLEL